MAGGLSLDEREVRAFNERARTSTLALSRVMLAIARTDLLPDAPLGRFVRTDAAATINKMRAKAYQEDCPGRAAASREPKPPPAQKKAVKYPRRGERDHTVYRFVLPDGSKVECTRREVMRRCPWLNPGSLSELVNGRFRQSKGVRCLGPVVKAAR